MVWDSSTTEYVVGKMFWRLIFSWLGDVEEDMDEFEVDGFLVGSDEDKEDSGEEDNPKQTQKKKKRKLLYFPTL